MGPHELYFTASLILIIIGIYAVMSKRHIVKIVIGLELLTLGVNLAIATTGLRIIDGVSHVDALAQSMVAISMAIGAAIAALALSLAINIYRHYGTFDVRKLRRLRW
ncbi:MAG: NADH-quinone oxidoreductase subunit K [Aigarchaeota archaeon]|nr:NADH-quinone oxidoreductase subunit K [Aigarchaeota archaeon]MDW8021230.1 NADH-quinone oxidoreductase subunit K [Nitrososphaerota archaeon]